MKVSLVIATIGLGVFVDGVTGCSNVTSTADEDTESTGGAGGGEGVSMDAAAGQHAGGQGGNDGIDASVSSGGTGGTGGNASGGAGGTGGDASGGVGGTGGDASGGSGGTGGDASGGAGSMAGSGGFSGSGGAEPDGQAGTGPCDIPVSASALLDAQFDSDVFLSSSWVRTNSSVTVSGGLMLISSNGSYDDSAEVTLAGADFPIAVELRARLVSGGQGFLTPGIQLWMGTGGYLSISYLDSINSGWQLTTGFEFTGSTINAPASEGAWMTLRMFIGTSDGVLCAKADSQSEYTQVATASWSITAGVTKILVKQPWDAVCELDLIRVLKL